ncbi:MAG: VWA domain-containing protein [Planctomycetota bacterium]|nr:VWA domain-containing protein [Planctomycetota bacterium]
MERLLGLTRVPFEGGHLAFEIGPPFELVLLAALAAVLLSWISYRATREGVAPFVLYVLVALRALVVMGAFACVLGPVWSSSVSVENKPTVALLYDRSNSMNLADNNLTQVQQAGAAWVSGLTESFNSSPSPKVREKVRELTRSKILKDALKRGEKPFKDALGEFFSLRRYEFASTVRSADKGLTAEQRRATALGDAIRGAVTELASQDLAGLVVFSDGGSNKGMQPVQAARFARSQGVAVFTVGFGGTDEPRDLDLQPVEYRSTIFKGDELVLSTAVAARGYEDIPVSVTLSGDHVETRNRIVRVSSSNSPTPVELRTKFEQAGEYSLEIRLDPAEGETLLSNNVRRASVTVVDDRIRALVVAGSPSWEYRFIKSALLRDPTMQCSILLQRNGGWFYEGDHPQNTFPATLEEFLNFDVVLLADVALDGYIPSSSLDALEKFVADTGGGLVYVAGEYNGLSQFSSTALQRLLPVALAQLPPAGDFSDPYIPARTPEGRTHPALRLAADDERNDELWRKLPALFWHYPVSRVKPGARVLLRHPGAGADPLAVEAYYGRGRVFFSAFDSSWRWRRKVGDRYFYRYWGQLLRHLAQEKILGSDRLKLEVGRRTYDEGDEVSLLARALDLSMKPAGVEQLLAQVRMPDGSARQLSLDRERQGAAIYRASFDAVLPGEYTCSLKWEDMEASVTFLVEEISAEKLTLRQKDELLRTLAAESGGEYLAFYELDALSELLKNLRTSSDREISESLLDAPLVWGLLILLLAAEWVIRRFARLL